MPVPRMGFGAPVGPGRTPTLHGGPWWEATRPWDERDDTHDAPDITLPREGTYNSVVWTAETVIYAEEGLFASRYEGRTSENLIVNMQNAWWAAATTTHVRGLVLYVDASFAVNLYSVDLAAVIWTSASVTNGRWQTTADDIFTRAAIATTPGSTRVIVTWVTSDRAVVGVESADGLTFSAPVAISSPSEIQCQQVSVVLGEADAAIVVYAATDTATDAHRVYFAYSDDGGVTWQGPHELDAPATGSESSFPSVAISGSADANGDGPVIVFAWRDDTPDPSFPDRTYVSIYYRAMVAADLVSALGSGAFAWADLPAVLVAGTRDDDYRDPCVWGTPTGSFTISFSDQLLTNVPRDPAVAFAAETSGPAHGAVWTAAELDLVYTDSQNFVNGTVAWPWMWAVASWEYASESSDTTSIYGAVRDLRDPSSPWVPVGQLSAEHWNVETVRSHTVWAGPDGGLILGYIWISADRTRAELRVRNGTVLEAP